MTVPENRKALPAALDHHFPVILLMLLAATALGLTAHLMRWGGGSLSQAFVGIPTADAGTKAPEPALEEALDQAVLRCNLESVDGASRVGDRFRVHRGLIAIRGWMVDSRDWTRPMPAVLRLNTGKGTKHDFDLGPGIRRGDVARRFSASELAMAGFATTINLGPVAPGTYSISLVFPSGRAECAPRLSMEVRP